MPFHIRDPETDALVRRLAREKGRGLTDTVKLAVREALDRVGRAIPLRDRIAALRADAPARPPTGLEAGKAFFDDLSGEA
jgi:antitoxin VapB